MKIPMLLLLFALAVLPVSATEVVPSVLVQTYTVDDYEGSCQNWDIAISPTGIMYVGNNMGLLTFDGNTWRTYELPNKEPVMKVTFHGERIYTIGETTKGYWQEDGFGSISYHPVDDLPAEVDFANPYTDYAIPDEVISMRPSAFATAGDLHFTGTETNGLYVTDSAGNVLLHLNNQNEFPDNIIRSICVQDVNLIWVAFDNGLCKIEINPPILRLGKRTDIGKLEAATLHGNDIYIKTTIGYFKKGLYSSDYLLPISEEEAGTFSPSNFSSADLSSGMLLREMGSLTDFPQADNVYPAPEDMFWLTRGNEAALFQRENENATLKCRIMFRNYNINLVTRGPQIFPLNDSLYLASAMQGTYLVNTRRLIAEGLGNFTLPRFTRIEYGDKEGMHNLLPTAGKMSLPHSFRDFSIYVGTTVFTPIHQISYYVEGITSDWSPWQNDGKISFFQLPEGKYTMRIRKYVARGPFPEITLQIEVLPPWYNTVWAYLIYIAIAYLFVWGILRYNLRQLRKEEQMKLKEKEEEERKKMQEMKSEMLETELQNKNNELSLQTSALIKRNQSIRELIEELDKQKSSLAERYPNKMYSKLRSLMEDAISDKDDWILFESYFNSAHQSFMERLREQYTDLTPGDLRICCLLRMQLLSKEIASLMNVSVRAVELRRYRLRKRLSLDNETNLIDFLISF